MSEPFADDFRCSMSGESWGAIRSEFEEVLGEAGFLAEFETDRALQHRLDGGTVKVEVWRNLRIVSASGQALARLRGVRLLGAALGVIGKEPHRVTGLHATLDRREPTASVLSAILERAESADGLRAGRKRIPVVSLLRFLHRMPDGTDTGTVYCGKASAEIRPVVYDKRQERLARGLPDLGYDLTRYELRLRSGVGMTLRDVFDPAPVFWHYMAPDFLPRPDGVADWSPEAEGFAWDRPSPALPAARLQRAAEGCESFRSLVKLAGTYPGGIDHLCALVRRMDRGTSVVELPPVGTGVQGRAPADALLGSLAGDQAAAGRLTTH